MKHKTFYVEAKDGGLEYRVVWNEFDGGLLNCLYLYTYGETWTKEYRGTLLYALVEDDGVVDITRYEDKDTVSALHVLIETFNRKNGHPRWYSKYRLLTVQDEELAVVK